MIIGITHKTESNVCLITRFFHNPNIHIFPEVIVFNDSINIMKKDIIEIGSYTVNSMVSNLRQSLEGYEK